MAARLRPGLSTKSRQIVLPGLNQPDQRAALRTALLRFLDAWNVHEHPFAGVKTPGQILSNLDFSVAR